MLLFHSESHVSWTNNNFSTLSIEMKLTYCVRCRKSTMNDNMQTVQSKNGRTMMKSTCQSCHGKKATFVSSFKRKGST